MNPDAFSKLDRLVVSACAQRNDYVSSAVWEEVKKAYTEDLPKLKEAADKLGTNLEQLTEPPLIYGIYLEESNADKHYLVVGIGPTRMEVNVAQGTDIDIGQLQPGQLVVL